MNEPAAAAASIAPVAVAVAPPTTKISMAFSDVFFIALFTILALARIVATVVVVVEVSSLDSVYIQR